MQRYLVNYRLSFLILPIALLITAASTLNAQSTLKLEKGDHVTIVGNALPERMNHFGYFESLLHSRFPKKNLVVRNIGYGGDVVDDSKNLRVQNYGSRDDWLGRLETDVVIAMYGFNESFRGTDKLDAFRKEVENFVKHVTGSEYHGTSSTRLALVSPIAFEDLNDPNLPDGSKQNKNLKAYTQAMQSVAKKHDVPFVNLFKPTRKAYQSDDQNWTFNAVHLREYGYRKLSWILDRRLFGERPSRNIDMDKLRAAINEKNQYWFDRYRVNDGYNVYGGRADLSYEPNNTSNREVYKREMEILEQMTANRDKKVWALAQGKNYEVTDDNLPENIEVETNAPGDGPGGKHTFLGGKEAIKKMDLHENLEVNLYASEEQFPELISPLQIKYDTKGRMWTNAWEGYPNYRPPGEKKDELIYFEDTDGDGQADERTIFADHLNNPTGFHFWNGGVIVAESPYILFLKDTNGDGKADFRRRMLSHISAADSHHAANSFVWDAGGALLFQEGTFHRTQIETPYGVVRDKEGTVWRFEPDSYRVEKYGNKGWANTHGHVINRWNQGFVFDATSAESYHDTLFSGYLPYPKTHNEPPHLYSKRTRPLPGVEILSSTHFPKSMRGDLLVANVIGFRGILRYDLRQEGASYKGYEQDPIVRSSDPNFRPVGMTVGPKGALYVCDWQNPIIGHMQHHIRDPSRDHEHGRIYRITYEGRSLHEEKKIHGQPIPHLLDLLKNPENYVRLRAKIEMSERNSKKVVQETDEWIQELDPQSSDYEHHVLEGLWVHQWHNIVDAPLLKKVLNFEDHRARAAAVRVLSYWRHDVDGALDLMEDAVNDSEPLVRLEAVRALSFFKNARAAELAVQVLNHDMDKYLEYTLNETMRALDPYWKNAMNNGKPVASDNYAGLNYLLARVGDVDRKREFLLNQPETPAVLQTILLRNMIPLDRRKKALRQLAEARDEKPVDLLMTLLTERDATASLVPLLEEMDPDVLAPHADRLAKLADQTSSSSVREAAYITLAAIDGDLERIKPSASRSVQYALTFLVALEQIQDKQVRKAAYPFVKSLVFNPPSGKGDTSSKAGVFRVFYYSKETENATLQAFANRTPKVRLRTNRVTTELEPVKSEGTKFALKYHARMNIQKPGKYTFHLTSDDGSRLFIDGNEVINNDGSHGPKEKSGRLQLSRGTHELIITQFDKGGGYALSLKWTPPGGEKQDVPKEIFLAGAEQLRKQAIEALASLPESADTRFTDMVHAMDRTDHVRTAGLEAMDIAKHLDQIPSDLAERAVRSIGTYAEQLSASKRSSKEVSDLLAFAQKLTGFVEGSAGKQLKTELQKLRVRQITIETVEGEMRYDTKEFTVAPGQHIAIVLKNTDKIPHNLVITVPGAYEFVGKASMEQDDGASHEYIPKGKKVREKIKWHTSLLDAGESERLVFKAPDTPDDYPYVCTFPGHWRTMKGVMHVR
jgi:azurin/glucose/arabinose dehydrogenase/lysophospholipase L1-like esterase